MLRYRLHLEPDDNGTILTTSPDLPIVTFGADEAEAFRQAADAISTVIESIMSARDLVPWPDRPDMGGAPYHATSLLTEMKVRLHNEMLSVGVTRAELSRLLRWNRESVDRLFRLNHNSRLDQIEAAFKALGRVVDVTVRDAA